VNKIELRGFAACPVRRNRYGRHALFAIAEAALIASTAKEAAVAIEAPKPTLIASSHAVLLGLLRKRH